MRYLLFLCCLLVSLAVLHADSAIVPGVVELSLVPKGKEGGDAATTTSGQVLVFNQECHLVVGGSRSSGEFLVKLQYLAAEGTWPQRFEVAVDRLGEKPTEVFFGAIPYTPGKNQTIYETGIYSLEFKVTPVEAPATPSAEHK